MEELDELEVKLKNTNIANAKLQAENQTLQTSLQACKQQLSKLEKLDQSK